MPTIEEIKADILFKVKLLKEKAANERIAAKQARSDGDEKAEATYLLHAMHYDSQITDLMSQYYSLK